MLPGGTAIDRSYHQLWRPLRFTEQNRTRNYHWLSAVARLKPGVSLEQARANMAMIAARIAVDHPETNKTWGVRVSPFKDGVASGQLRPLGASRAQLLRHLLTRGMSLVGIGCALGLILTLAANRLMTAFLYGESASDPVSLGLGLVLLSASAWLACYLPARRAANVDPIICLRSE